MKHFKPTYFVPYLKRRLHLLPDRKILPFLFALLLSICSFAPAQAQCDLTLTPTNITNTTCGGKEGSFQVQVTGMVAPYGYRLLKEINGSFEQQEIGTLIAGNPTFVGLTAGTYKLEVDKNGTCTGSVTVELTQTSLILTPANLNSPSCGGNDGSFQVQAGGIVVPYQYRLLKEINGNFVSQENGTLIAGNLTFVGLTGGNYKVEVNKSGTCSGSVTVELPQESLSLTPANINAATCGGNDGSFQVQAGGIVVPYQYRLLKEISGNFVSQENGTLIAGNLTFVGLTGGNYKVEVNKSGTCSGSITVELPQENLGLSLGNLISPSCSGSDGSFQVQATGIVAPYQYRLLKELNGNFEMQEMGTLIGGNPTFPGLTVGRYKVEVEKNGGCNGSIYVYLNCETIGKEGCGPGYWKNSSPAWLLTNYSPTQTVESVFNVPDSYGLDNLTLQQALESTGGTSTVGAALILLRAATAAILNAAHPDVEYSGTLQSIITGTNTALAGGNRNTMLQLATKLDKQNNFKCPLTANSGMTRSQAIPGDGISDLSEGLNLKVMPNPSAGAFNLVLESNAKEKVSMYIMDMQGRLVERREQMPSNKTFRLGENYIPGMYLVEMIQGKNRKQIKLVKIK